MNPLSVDEVAAIVAEEFPVTDARATAAKVSRKAPRFTYLDHGIDRIVFKVDAPEYQNKVVKLARRPKGKLANENEYKNWKALKETEHGDWLCPATALGEDGLYIVMDETDPAEGSVEEVQQGLASFPPEEITPSNIGRHPSRGSVMIDYSWTFDSP